VPVIMPIMFETSERRSPAEAAGDPGTLTVP